MKKLLTLILAAALALSLAACGDKRDYSTDFTGKMNITSVNMTVNDVIALEGGVDYETEDLGDSKLLTFDNGHIYRFSTKKGSFESVKYTLQEEFVNAGLEMWEKVIDASMLSLTDSYGEPEVNKDTYTWYGNVNGEKVSFSIIRGITNLTPSSMELAKVS